MRGIPPWSADDVNFRTFESVASHLGRWFQLVVSINSDYRHDEAGSHRSKAMGLIVVLVLLLLLFGGGGLYFGPPYHYYGGGLGLLLLIVVVVLLFRGRA
jgi:hypothetical protein